MDVPTLPPQVPRRGNRCTRALGRLVLWLGGWRIAGNFPDRGKFVAIVAPHTSNWDFVFGVAALLALGLDAHWLGKHTLFRWGGGTVMRGLGGFPVDRNAPHGVAAQMTRLFGEQDRLVLGITPEGTRRRVERWRTGFYVVAEQAQVPIVLCYLDYAAKVAGIGPTLSPSGDLERDLRKIMDFYRGIRAKHPGQFHLDVRS